MDKFRTKIRNRVLFLIILFISLIAIYLILLLNQDSLPKTSGRIMSFHAGILSGFGVWCNNSGIFQWNCIPYINGGYFVYLIS